MRLRLLLISIFSLFLLTACGDSGSDNKVNANSHLLDSQMKAMDKARQVEGDINAAMQRRDKEMNR